MTAVRRGLDSASTTPPAALSLGCLGFADYEENHRWPWEPVTVGQIGPADSGFCRRGQVGPGFRTVLITMETLGPYPLSTVVAVPPVVAMTSRPSGETVRRYSAV